MDTTTSGTDDRQHEAVSVPVRGAAERGRARASGVEPGAAAVRATSALAAVPLLRELGPRHLQAIADMGRLRRYGPGEVIFEEGEAGDTLHLIAEGITRVVRISSEGGEVLIARLGPGEVLGELALIDGGARSATAIAEEPSAHVVIGRAPFQRWLEGEPAAALALLRTLVGRLRLTDESLYSVTLQSLSERIARLLAGEALDDGSVRMTQSELARRLGVTRESVNKHLRRLESAGVVALSRGRCTILDRRALETSLLE